MDFFPDYEALILERQESIEWYEDDPDSYMQYHDYPPYNDEESE